jgi:hypothetical protein
MNKLNLDSEDRNGIEYLINTTFMKSVDARKRGDFEAESLYLKLRDELLLAFDTSNLICNSHAPEKKINFFKLLTN